MSSRNLSNRPFLGEYYETKRMHDPNEALDVAFFPSIRKIATSAFSTNRSCKSRWNANEMGFKPEEGSVKLEGPPASSTTKQTREREKEGKSERDRVRAVMNSSTPFGERTPLAERKLPERMEILVESRDS